MNSYCSEPSDFLLSVWRFAWCTLCPSPVLPTHYVGMWPLLLGSSSTVGPFSQKGAPNGLIFTVIWAPVFALRFKQRCTALWAINSELRRTRNILTCIFSSYTGRKSYCVFAYFGLACVVRLFKVEHSKQESSKHCFSDNDFYSSLLRLYLEFWKICFFLVYFASRVVLW